jgi:hypothetical protein
MWIETNYQPLYNNHLKVPKIGKAVEFNKNGKVNTTQQVADILCSQFDHIEKCNNTRTNKESDL